MPPHSAWIGPLIIDGGVIWFLFGCELRINEFRIADALLHPKRGRKLISPDSVPQDILGPTQCRHGPREADGRQRKQNRVPDLLR
jgi:hypothetical protein